MIRARVVKHPSEWPFCGYNEIQSNRCRYRLIDLGKLLGILQMKNQEELKASYKEWIESRLVSKHLEREGRWIEGIAVGSEGFC